MATGHAVGARAGAIGVLGSFIPIVEAFVFGGLAVVVTLLTAA
jgi:hypothetical protein